MICLLMDTVTSTYVLKCFFMRLCLVLYQNIGSFFSSTLGTQCTTFMDKYFIEVDVNADDIAFLPGMKI